MFERFKCVRVNHHTGRFVRVPTLFCTSVSDGVAQKGNSCPYRYSADDGCTLVAPQAIAPADPAPWP